MAKDILPVHWLTDDSYKKHARIDGYQRDDLRRKIVLMSEWDAYEYLWPHTLGLTNFNKKELELCEMKFYKHPYVTIKEKLSQTPKDAKIHLRETMELFKRAEYRSRITNEALGPI